MQRVRPGKIARDTRRKSALERMEKHLEDMEHHKGEIDAEWAKAHDAAQRKELAHLKELSGGIGNK